MGCDIDLRRFFCRRSVCVALAAEFSVCRDGSHDNARCHLMAIGHRMAGTALASDMRRESFRPGDFAMAGLALLRDRWRLRIVRIVASHALLKRVMTGRVD